MKKIDSEAVKRIIFNKKLTLPSLSNRYQKTVKAKTEKINELSTYLNEQHQGIKQTNRCMRKTSQYKNRSFSKEDGQKLKTWMGN